MPTIVVNVRTDEYDVLIDRTTPLGNPFRIGPDGNRDAVCGAFQVYFEGRIRFDPEFRRKVEALRGKRIGCWCKPKRCHGDTYKAWLEGEMLQ